MFFKVKNKENVIKINHSRNAFMTVPNAIRTARAFVLKAEKSNSVYIWSGCSKVDF